MKNSTLAKQPFIEELHPIMLRAISRFLISCLFPVASVSFAEPVIPPVDGCVLYGHTGFTGGSFQMAPGDEFFQFSSDIDNKISSVRVGKYCTLFAYNEWLFEGQSGVYATGEYPTILPNDAMTSAKCICDFVN